MADEFKFEIAVRERVAMLIGLGGPSGSGKTLTALLIARGLCGDDSKIFGIDTEQGRMRHYACAPGEKPGKYKFSFRYLSLAAPFTPERYAGAILAAEKAGAEVIIIDSMSHEHEGVGGILEQHEAMLTRMAGMDYSKRDAMKFSAWIEPKKRHNKLVNTLLQRRPHLIFCFRAKEKLKMIKNAKGKNEPVNTGWTAICSDRFEYEMTMLLMLPPGSKGVPDLEQPHNKINEDHRALVAKYAKTQLSVDEAFGKDLAKWADGGAEPAPKPEASLEEPIETTGVDDLATQSDPTSPEIPYDQETGEVLQPKPAAPLDEQTLRWAWPTRSDPPEVWKSQAAAALNKVQTLQSSIMIGLWEEQNWTGGLELMREVSNPLYQWFGGKLAEHKERVA